MSAGREEIQKTLGPDGETRIREDTKTAFTQYARLGDRLVRNFVQFLKVY